MADFYNTGWHISKAWYRKVPDHFAPGFSAA